MPALVRELDAGQTLRPELTEPGGSGSLSAGAVRTIAEG
jgi:hypothetical protein